MCKNCVNNVFYVVTVCTLYLYAAIDQYFMLFSISTQVTSFKLHVLLLSLCGPGSSVSIVTEYLLDSPGIESRWGRDFPPVQTDRGAHPAYCTMGTGSFPGLTCGRGMLLTTHPLLVPQSWKSRATHLNSLWPTMGL